MKYVALIQKRNEFGNRHYSISDGTETKERFIERMENAYIKPYKTPYWDLEIYELGEAVY
jgi:hypothetical protein